MYRYLKGIITEINPGSITVECNQIGYLIRIANPYQYNVGEEYTIHLYHHVREDLIELFGFLTTKERDLFIRFLDVKGLGPKGALAILASATPEEIISALNKANASFFIRFPGIGPKTSQQIVLDLKGKIQFNDFTIAPQNEKLINAESALKALGYRNDEIKGAFKDLDFNNDIETSEIVKKALRKLNKK